MSSLPDSLSELSRVCIECGDRVDEQYLDSEGRCVGCRYGGER
ncbi:MULTISPECIES: hypothetical protein [Salinibaculum]